MEYFIVVDGCVGLICVDGRCSVSRIPDSDRCKGRGWSVETESTIDGEVGMRCKRDARDSSNWEGAGVDGWSRMRSDDAAF